MDQEQEVKFMRPDVPKLRLVLSGKGKPSKPRRLMKRANFSIPGNDDVHQWARVRDEGDKITLTYKRVENNKQYEVEVAVDDFENAKKLLRGLGLQEVKYQENYREDWEVDGATVSIDEWPKIGAIVEVEADSQEKVRAVSQSLGLDWKDAYYHGRDLEATDWAILMEDHLAFEQ